MDKFGAYSVYYDLLYRDKNYFGEADYVLSLAKTHHCTPKSILSFGCGTGSYELLLGERGYEVHGVDLSETMLNEARKKASDKNLDKKVTFEQCDVTKFKSERNYDLVVSLFHVASYQTDSRDFANYLKAASSHLNPGGLFIFDFWYGPCVLSEPIMNKVKRFSDDNYSVTRVSEPQLNWAENTINVNFDISIEEKKTGSHLRLSEVHPMRYFFEPEIKIAADRAGFKVEAFHEWMKTSPPALHSFSSVCVLKKG